MTGDASASARELEGEAERRWMVEQLDVGVAEAVRKIENGRIRDEAKEQARAQWCRTLGYLLRTRNELVRDRRLEQLAEDVEALKEHQERAKYR